MTDSSDVWSAVEGFPQWEQNGDEVRSVRDVGIMRDPVLFFERRVFRMAEQLTGARIEELVALGYPYEHLLHDAQAGDYLFLDDRFRPRFLRQKDFERCYERAPERTLEERVAAIEAALADKVVT